MEKIIYKITARIGEIINAIAPKINISFIGGSIQYSKLLPSINTTHLNIANYGK